MLTNLSTDYKESDHNKAQISLYFLKKRSYVAKAKTCNINAEMKIVL